MKQVKVIALTILCMVLFVACAKNTGNQSEDKTAESAINTPAPTQAAEETKDEAGAAVVDETNNKDASEDVLSAEKTKMNIAALKGPTGIGMVQLMDLADKQLAGNDYQFNIFGTADEISAGLVKGEIDIAAIPCNLASVLYNKTEGQIKVAGINTLGVLYIIETGNDIKSVEDLKGRTIYSTGFGTTPQYTLNYLLSAYGLDPEKDVTIEYKTEATEVAALLEGATDAVAMLPQPFVTTVMMKNDKVRIALDVAAEWEAAVTDNSDVVTGVVVVRSEFLESNKEAFEVFMEEYAESAAFANEQIEETALLTERFDIFKAEPMKKAIPYCNITMIRGEEMKEKVNGYLMVLFNQNPQAVGGKLPDDSFYYLP